MNVEPIEPQVDLHEHILTKLDQSESKWFKKDRSGSEWTLLKITN